MDKRDSIYLIEICDVTTNRDAELKRVELIPYCFCNTEEEAIMVCEELNKEIEPYQQMKIKDEDVNYPFYQFLEVPRYRFK